MLWQRLDFLGDQRTDMAARFVSTRGELPKRRHEPRTSQVFQEVVGVSAGKVDDVARQYRLFCNPICRQSGIIHWQTVELRRAERAVAPFESPEEDL
jgi:hypothetical protein